MTCRQFPIVVLAGLLAGAATPAAHWGSATVDMADGFEAPGLNDDLWSRNVLIDGAATVQGQVVRSGRQALALTVRPEDVPLGDGKERAELGENPRYYRPFGTEVWYGFSWHVPEPVPDDGNRIVIGQWQNVDGGRPFLAQRFRNGDFYITVFDATGPDFDMSVPTSGCLVRIAREHCERPARPVRCGTDLTVEEFGCLPSPTEDWVDMVYRVDAGADGNGLVEVWANGVLVSRATGSFGYRNADWQFFKFGPYRDPVDYPTTVYFDNYRRGTSHEAVDPRTFPIGSGQAR